METSIQAPQWQSLNKFPKFWDFQKNPVFKGFFVRQYESENPKSGEKIIGFIFSDEDGCQRLIGANHQIAQAIEAAPQPSEGKEVLFRFEFTGKVKLSGGRTVNNFNCAFAEVLF
ncbi:MAG: hypothetical protein HC905_26140 [Bacteroidales bacterium]|nr:hypothetical protein [Bacteroidales bacterium]